MVNQTPNLPVTASQAKILEAARTIFMHKGKDGARMQEIADEAGINKALLHYYFRNKETLFLAVFGEVIRDLVPALAEIFRSDRPLLEKIAGFLKIHIGFIQANPLVPHFIISEIARNPEMIINGFKSVQEENLIHKFRQDVNASIERGEIRPIDPLQLIVNILSLSVFPFLARPLLMSLFGIGQMEFDQLIENRKTEVSQFILNSLT